VTIVFCLTMRLHISQTTLLFNMYLLINLSLICLFPAANDALHVQKIRVRVSCSSGVYTKVLMTASICYLLNVNSDR